MIEAVLFDAGGTLHRSKARAELAPDVLRRALDVPVPWSDEKLRESYSRSHAALRERYTRSGQSRRGSELDQLAREHAAAWLEALGVTATDARMDAVVSEWARREPIDRYAPGAREALFALHARGLALGLVSNTFRDHRKSLARDGLSGLFRVVILSIEIGIWKPDPRIFTIACAELGLPPDRVAHVGDKEDKDVAPARAAGLHAIRIGEGGFAQVLAELERLAAPPTR